MQSPQWGTPVRVAPPPPPGQPPLSSSDYQQLLDLARSPDPADRERGSALAKTLTPVERQAFFEFQQSVFNAAQERGIREHGADALERADRRVLGIDPEFVAG